VFLNAILDPVLDVFGVIGVSHVLRSDWHNHPLAARVVPVKRAVGAVTDHPDLLSGGERVTRNARRRPLWRLLTLCELCCYLTLIDPVETIVQPWL
jgi:hypothetical protein